MNVRNTLLASTLACVTGLGLAAGDEAAAQAGDTDAAPSCLARPNVRRMQIVDEHNILFVMRDRTMFRNELTRDCPGLRRDSQISLTAADRQVCAGSSFQVLLRVGMSSNSESVLLPGGTTISMPRPNMVPGPVCILGAFTPIGDDEAKALVEARANERAEERASRRDRRRGDAESDAIAR